MNSFILKHLRDPWNLRDGFTNKKFLREMLMLILIYFRYCTEPACIVTNLKYLIGEMQTNGQKSAKFVSISPIILAICKFI